MKILQLAIDRRDDKGEILLDVRLEALDKDGHKFALQKTWVGCVPFDESHIPDAILAIVRHVVSFEFESNQNFTYFDPLARFKTVPT